MVDPDLTIGELAVRTGVATSALRYHEEIGLIPAPADRWIVDHGGMAPTDDMSHDENWNGGFYEQLRADGREAVHVFDIGLATANDEVIYDQAERAGYTIITADTDFPTLVALRRATSTRRSTRRGTRRASRRRSSPSSSSRAWPPPPRRLAP